MATGFNSYANSFLIGVLQKQTANQLLYKQEATKSRQNIIWYFLQTKIISLSVRVLIATITLAIYQITGIQTWDLDMAVVCCYHRKV